uniref:Uncharacterized protein n=1 Tax=Anguilla anguilla TaxID=7936 RepID=A0A0E9XZA9_ANGAN
MHNYFYISCSIFIFLMLVICSKNMKKLAHHNGINYIS